MQQTSNDARHSAGVCLCSKTTIHENRSLFLNVLLSYHHVYIYAYETSLGFMLLNHDVIYAGKNRQPRGVPVSLLW
jgi:hypothetical protein